MFYLITLEWKKWNKNIAFRVLMAFYIILLPAILLTAKRIEHFPPPIAQLNYAASDVLYLHQLKTILTARLLREKRFELAKACFDFLPARAQLDLNGWDDIDIFSHSLRRP